MYRFTLRYIFVFSAKQSRSLLDAVTSLTDGTKLGTALKIVSAFDKVGKFINDLKGIAPEAHAALQGSITDIQNSMSDIVSNLAGNLENAGTTTARENIVNYSQNKTMSR